jgi:hypothetical protein
MAWIRIDDHIAHHPKFTKVSPIACWLWVTGLGFAQQYLTDGFIPRESIPALSHIANPDRYVNELLKTKLWERRKGGFQIHDYLEFNESAKVVKERRKQDRLRKAAARKPARVQPESKRSPKGFQATMVAGRRPDSG